LGTVQSSSLHQMELIDRQEINFQNWAFPVDR
jgi:hypothetical protein